jgi:hypothetical protein
MAKVTFARVAQRRITNVAKSETNASWKGFFAKRVFCQEEVSTYTVRRLLLSAVHKWNHWYYLHKQV